MADLVDEARARQLPQLADVDAVYLGSLITAASTWAERYCKRFFTSTAYVSQAYDGNGTRVMFLDNFPLTTLTSIVVVEADGTEVTIVGTEFDSDGNTAEIKYKRNCSATYCYFPSGFQNIKANYTAGFATIPQDVQEAVCQIILHMYSDGSHDPAIASQRLGDFQEGYRPIGFSSLDPIVKTLLNPYRRVHI